MKLLSIVFLMAIAIGCKQPDKIPGNFDYGSLDYGVYKNDFFDMEIPVAGWDVQSRVEMNKIVEKGTEKIGGNDKKLAEELKVSQVTTANLLMMFKYPPDAFRAYLHKFNSSLVVIAENIATKSHIKTGTDYLDEFKKVVDRIQPGFELSPYYSTKKIGNRQFDVLQASIKSGADLEVTQLYCCTVEKGFALVMTLSFADDQQEDELTSMLRKIKLK